MQSLTNSSADSIRWLVSQIGAREHYSIPRGFAARGRLRTLYTDVWCTHCARLLRAAPMPLRAMAGRRHSEISPDYVVSFNSRSILDRLLHRAPSTTQGVYEYYLRFGSQFSSWVTRHLERQELDPARDVFFGMNTSALKTLELLKPRGIRTMVDQIDPARVEEQLVHEESEKWPGWERLPGRIPQAYFDHLTAEWELADVVLVNSEWSKAALMKQGVPERKLLVVPVSYELSGLPVRRYLTDGPLQVLWLGTVNLRKGIPYLIQAANQLKDRNIQFLVAGPIEISDDAVRSAPPSVKFLGRVARTSVADLYRKADVFALPTISDGFAITQVEAMAFGLPVIATPRCGDVVTHNIDGMIVPAGDAAALAQAIASFDDDRNRLLQMSESASMKSRQFSPHRHAEMIEARALTIPVNSR